MLGMLALAPAESLAQANCQPQLGQPPLVQAGVLTAAINPTVAPIQYIDESGKLVGLDVDLGDMIAARLCLKMNFVSTQFATMIPGLKEGRFDMIDTFMYYTPERAAQVLMIPYGAATLAIVVPSANKDTISDLAYFSGKRFAVQLGSIDEKTTREFSDSLVKSGKPPIDVRSFPNYSDVLQTLSAGQVDGGFVGTEQAYYYRKKNIGFFRVAVAGLYPHTEALAFKDRDVADRVAAVLNAMRADGSFDKLFGSYHHCTLPPPYQVTTGAIDTPQCPAQPD
jgi:polar amino acid transport system substrate-binding protein